MRVSERIGGTLIYNEQNGILILDNGWIILMEKELFRIYEDDIKL